MPSDSASIRKVISTASAYQGQCHCSWCLHVWTEAFVMLDIQGAEVYKSSINYVLNKWQSANSATLTDTVDSLYHWVLQKFRENSPLSRFSPPPSPYPSFNSLYLTLSLFALFSFILIHFLSDFLFIESR